MAGYNHAAAFVAFSRGTPVDDIAHALAIPLDTLTGWVRNEGWAKLSGEMSSAVSIPAAKAERDLARIQDNRDRNAAIALKLQADLGAVVDSLLDGSLMLTRILSSGMQVQHKPGIQDRAHLGAYAKSVAELSYRALGDALTAKEVEGMPGAAATVHIHLPAQVASPRVQRPQVLELQGIDIESKVVTLEAPSLPGLHSEVARDWQASLQPAHLQEVAEVQPTVRQTVEPGPE